MVLSTGQTLNSHRVRRIPRMKDLSHKIATWNVQSLGEPGKMHNLFREIKRPVVNIMEFNERRWSCTDTLNKENFNIYYCCSQDTDRYHSHGVAIIADNTSKQAVRQFLLGESGSHKIVKQTYEHQCDSGQAGKRHHRLLH